MCPLDMQGLIGAAMVTRSLQHGAGTCEPGANGRSLDICFFPSLAAPDLEDSWQSMHRKVNYVHKPCHADTCFDESLSRKKHNHNNNAPTPRPRAFLASFFPM